LRVRSVSREEVWASAGVQGAWVGSALLPSLWPRHLCDWNGCQRLHRREEPKRHQRHTRVPPLRTARHRMGGRYRAAATHPSWRARAQCGHNLLTEDGTRPTRHGGFIVHPPPYNAPCWTCSPRAAAGCRDRGLVEGRGLQARRGAWQVGLEAGGARGGHGAGGEGGAPRRRTAATRVVHRGAGQAHAAHYEAERGHEGTEQHPDHRRQGEASAGAQRGEARGERRRGSAGAPGDRHHPAPGDAGPPTPW